MRTGGKLGFTLVEVALSMSFIGVLSVTMVLIINDAVATYRRGLTLNSVSTSGTALIDELTSTIKYSSSQDLREQCKVYNLNADSGDDTTWTQDQRDCIADKAKNFIVLRRYADVELNEPGEGGNKKRINIPVYGAICTGSYSYIWNSGYFFGGADNGTVIGVDKAIFKYDSSTSGSPNNNGVVINPKTVENFRLLKVSDREQAVCKTMNKTDSKTYGVYHSGPDANTEDEKQYFEKHLDNVFDVTTPYNGVNDPDVIKYYNNGKGLSDDGVMVLYADDDTNPLALYDLTITTPASDINNTTKFYVGSFILGTLQGGIDVDVSGNFCKTPEGHFDEEFDYCAINKFNFAVQARGGTSG